MTYGYNSRYLTKDGKPWFPVMGEIHYSRYQDSLWEESLRKMKAGGLSIVSCYAIWIHHEEEELEGSVHIGIGTSITLGGTVKAACHYDLIMTGATLVADGRTLLENGRLCL